MALTLAKAQLLTQDKLWNGVVDELRKDQLLDMMIFDNTANYNGGSTLRYTYNKISVQPTAAFRQINEDYEAQEASTEAETVELKILGGKFAIDRVIIKYVKGIVQQQEFQMNQKIKAIKSAYSYCFINGNSLTNNKEFDGLEKLINPSMKFDSSVDLSDASKITTNYSQLTDLFRDAEAELMGAPTAWFCSREGYALVQKIADRATGFTTTKDNFGRETVYFNGARFVSLGDSVSTGKAVIKTDETGKTAFYPVIFGLDAVHGIAPEGGDVGITTYPISIGPDAASEGACEMVTALAVKNDRAAAKVVAKIKAGA